MTQQTKKMTGKKKAVLIATIAFIALVVITIIYDLIYRIQLSNKMLREGCRADAYDLLGLPERWQCPVNLSISAV